MTHYIPISLRTYVINNYDTLAPAASSDFSYGTNILSGTLKAILVPCPGTD